MKHDHEIGLGDISHRFLDRKVEASLKRPESRSRRSRVPGFLDRKVEASLKLAAPERCTLALHRFLDRKVEASLKQQQFEELRQTLLDDSSTERSRPH